MYLCVWCGVVVRCVCVCVREREREGGGYTSTRSPKAEGTVVINTPDNL